MLRRFILACCLVLFTGLSHAFEVLPAETFFNPTVAQSKAWKSIGFVNTLATLNSLPPNAAKNTKVPAAKPGSREATINKLVKVYSAGVRAQVKRNFNELSIGYRIVEQRFGIPKNDFAGALTIYVAGNYLALVNQDLPEAEQQVLFTTLYTQMRQVLKASRGFAKMKPEARRQLFDQLAILGAFPVATRLQLLQQPNPDIALALQDAAKRNLEAFFNVTVDRILITPTGLVIL